MHLRIAARNERKRYEIERKKNAEKFHYDCKVKVFSDVLQLSLADLTNVNRPFGISWHHTALDDSEIPFLISHAP